MRLTRDPTTAADTLAIVAMLAAMLAIIWAGIELYGTGDIESALVGELPPAAAAPYDGQQEAVVRNRWIVGFSQ